MNDFLPVSKEDMEKAHIRQLDFIYVTGDAYVDHPSFGVAIISRVLEAHGYSVGIIAQPDWKDDASIRILGEPRLGFLVSAGNMDSMVNHYYVSKKHRQTDSYTPGGKPYHRPDHATIVYGNLIRRSYKKHRSSSAGSKRVCAGLPITITGQIPLNVPYCWTAVQI